MFGTFFRRQQAGQRIAAREINQFIKPLERLSNLRVAAPLTGAPIMGGYAIGWGGPVVDLGFFNVPAPVPGATGSFPNITLGKGRGVRCFLDPASARFRVSGAVYDVYNIAPAPSGSITTVLICGLVDSQWLIMTEACTQGA